MATLSYNSTAIIPCFELALTVNKTIRFDSVDEATLYLLNSSFGPYNKTTSSMKLHQSLENGRCAARSIQKGLRAAANAPLFTHSSN